VGAIRSENMERLNIRLPKALVEDLRRYVPPRKRNQIITEGTARMLSEIKLKEALKAGAGAWTDENHPELRTPEDVERFLAELRASTATRLTE